MPREKKKRVAPWVTIVDTREQSPFAFMSIDDVDEVPVEYRALKTGDYSIAGMESRVSIERKSVSDFYHSIGEDRERFEREMVRLSEMEFAAVVIEGDWKELLVDRPSNIRMHAKSASHTILSWSIRYGVHFFPCAGRRHAELTTFHLLRHFWRIEQEHSKQGGKVEVDLLNGVV